MDQRRVIPNPNARPRVRHQFTSEDDDIVKILHRDLGVVPRRALMQLGVFPGAPLSPSPVAVVSLLDNMVAKLSVEAKTFTKTGVIGVSTEDDYMRKFGLRRFNEASLIVYASEFSAVTRLLTRMRHLRGALLRAERAKVPVEKILLPPSEQSVIMTTAPELEAALTKLLTQSKRESLAVRQARQIVDLVVKSLAQA